MIRYPLEYMEHVAVKLEEWEPWLGSILRLLTTIPDEVCPDAQVDELRGACAQAREQATTLAESLRGIARRMEESETELQRSLEQALSGFIESFDMAMQESLHLSALEFDLYRLGLGGTIPGHLLPAVVPLEAPPSATGGL